MIGPKPRENLASDKLFQGRRKPLNIVQIVEIRDDSGPSVPDEVDGGRVVYGRFVRLDDFEVIAAGKAIAPSSLIMANKISHARSYVPPRNLSLVKRSGA